MKRKMSKKKIAALVGGGVAGVVVLLAVLGAVFGTDEATGPVAAPVVTVTATATVTGAPAPAVTVTPPAVTATVAAPAVTAPPVTVTLPAVVKTKTVTTESTACVNALAMSEQTVRIQGRLIEAAGDAFTQIANGDNAAASKTADKVDKLMGQAVASRDRAAAAAIECGAGK